jgi:hypothetical protein
VTAAELGAWREGVLAAGEAALKARPTDGRDHEVGRLKTKFVDLTMTTERRSRPRRKSAKPCLTTVDRCN